MVSNIKSTFDNNIKGTTLGVQNSTWLFVLVIFAVVLLLLKRFFPRIFRMIPFYGKMQTARRRAYRRVFKRRSVGAFGELRYVNRFRAPRRFRSRRRRYRR